MVKTFRNAHGILSLVPNVAPTPFTMLARVIVGLPRLDASGVQQHKLIAHLQDVVAITEGYEWADGKALFDTSTSHFRKLQHAGKGGTHVSMAKWARYI